MEKRRSEEAGTFSEAEFSQNAARVVAHAAATGRAFVESPEGQPRVIITIPTTDLPTLDP